MAEQIREFMNYYEVIPTIIKLLVAMLCGGAIGLEREKKKRPAGFRTYMLVCVGSALVMITNEFLTQVYGTGDPARMGAQVISGIGFLGAGTIIVTGRNRVKGLTTAAGLWAAACVGLAAGAGYYFGAVFATILIVVVMSLFHLMDDWLMTTARVVNLYVELEDVSCVGGFMQFAKEHEMRISDLEVTKGEQRMTNDVAILTTLRLQKKRPHAEIIQLLSEVKGVRFLEEI